MLQPRSRTRRRASPQTSRGSSLLWQAAARGRTGARWLTATSRRNPVFHLVLRLSGGMQNLCQDADCWLDNPALEVESSDKIGNVRRPRSRSRKGIHADQQSPHLRRESRAHLGRSQHLEGINPLFVSAVRGCASVVAVLLTEVVGMFLVWTNISTLLLLPSA